MRLRRKLFGFIFLAFLIITSVSESVYALSLNSNGGTVNSHLNHKMNGIVGSTTIDGWHSSGGYWTFNYNDWTNSFRIYDANVASYFSGTSKLFSESLTISRTLPSDVQKFISIYGTDRLGIKMTVGKDGSINGNVVTYTISSNTISLTFRPILRYNTYNMWAKYNTTVWNQIAAGTDPDTYTPEVTSGYGENYVSIDNGAIGMLLTPEIMASAYKASDGKLRFTSNTPTTNGNGETVIPSQKYALNNFFYGGSTSAYFRYPINIEFYDLNVNVNPLTIDSYEYYNNGVYWVKSGDQFNLVGSSTASASDSVVKVNANYFGVTENGSLNYVNARIKETSNSNTSITGSTALSISGGTNKRNGNSLVSTVNASLSGDKDISVYSFGRLIKFPNSGELDFGNEQIYKNSSNSNTITIKSDSSAPVANSSSTTFDINSDSLNLNLNNVTDSRSGVKTNSITAVVYPKDNPSAKQTVVLNQSNTSYNNSFNLSGFGDYYGDIVVEYWTEDNVGNRGNVFTDTVERLAPNPTTTSVLIKDYEYEDSTTKWVKANDEFSIFQEGYSLVKNPTGSQIRINKNTTDIQSSNYSNGYSMTTTDYNAWSTNTPYIVKNRNTLLANSTKTENSQTRYYGTGNYYFTASPQLNGQKFYVFGTTELTINGTTYTGDYLRDPKMLGIDAKAPILNYTVSGGKANIVVEDKESGFNRAEVTVDGVKKTYTTPNFTIDSGSSITVVVYDNVGNSSTHTIKRDGWEGKYIKTWIGEVNGKKVLKYSVDAEINDTVINSNNTVTVNDHSLRFTAESNLYIKPIIIKNTTNTIHYENLVEDKYNQSYGPTLRYEKNNSTYSYVRWDHIEDLEDQVDLKLYNDGNPWDSVRKLFASGRKNYTWTLYQTKDRYGNAITKTKVGSGTVTGNELDVSTYKTGSYEIEVTMYDYNGNPSGTSRLAFDHVQPHIDTDVSDLFLKVTAVKDLNWESMDYPIKYNALEFPLGKNKLSKNGEGIKLGYTINFSIENLIKHNLSDYSATYTLIGENGEALTGTSNGKTFTESDSQDNTGYLTQNRSQITLDEDPRADATNNGYTSRLFFKHFLPADAEFYTSDGRPYRGKVTVRIKINLKEIGTDSALGDKNYTIDLYTIDTSDTAYDDLYIDKQR